MRRYTATLTANNTATVSLNENEDAQILLTQGNTGSYVVTWATVNKWFTPSGNPPTLKTAIGASDLITLWRTGGVIYATHTGDSGPTGATGATGPAGLVWRSTYNSANTYSINDAVYYSGSSYIALQASSSGNPQQPDIAPSFWSPLAAGGTVSAGGAETVDNFVRANNANISTGAPNGITYSQITGATGTAAIVSNQCQDADTTGANTEYRAETILTSVDHHCQVTAGTFTSNAFNDVEFGALVRCDASAHTAYMAVAFPQASQWRFYIYKIVTGTYTAIAGPSVLAAAPVAGDSIKLTATGSSLTATYTAGSTPTTLTATDSSITTGVRCGFHMSRIATGSVDVRLSELRFGT